MKPIRCLTKEILMKNIALLEIPRVSGGQDGANDGGTTIACEGEFFEVPEGKQETKEDHIRRVRALDGLSSDIRELSIKPSWETGDDRT
jgi:hypothetical protein